MVGMLSPITAQIGQPERINLGQDILGGMQANQQLQRGNLQNQAMQQGNADTDFQMNMRNLRIMNRLMKQARQTPPEARQQFVQSLDQQMLASIGVTPDVLAQTPMDDAGLDQLIGQTDAVLSSVVPQNQTQQQFGAQETLKDEQGNLFFSTSKRDPRTGQVTGVVAAVDGSDTKPVGKLSVAGGYGLTASERVGQLAAESGAKKQAEQNVIKSTQPEIERLTTDARTKAKLEAEKLFKQQGQMTTLADAQRIYKSLGSSDLDLIYGKGEKWYPEVLRSQKGVDLMVQRDQLIGMLNLAARGQLAGQGAISNTEADAILASATTLANPNISPDEAEAALESAMARIYGNAGQSFTPQNQAPAPQISIDDLVNQYAD